MGPLDPLLRFSRLLLKSLKIFLRFFFCFVLFFCFFELPNISYASFGEKKSYRLRRFHKLALLRHITKLVLAAIFKQNNFFQVLFQKCKCIYVVLLWAQFHWKIPLGKWFFSIFGQWLFSWNENLNLGNFFECSFC